MGKRQRKKDAYVKSNYLYLLREMEAHGCDTSGYELKREKKPGFAPVLYTVSADRIVPDVEVPDWITTVNLCPPLEADEAAIAFGFAAEVLIRVQKEHTFRHQGDA